MATTPAVDLHAVSAEISKLTPEQIKEKLLAIRVRQKVQQKKQTAKGSQKQYQQKQNEIRKALKAEAIRLGIYDDVNEEAEKRAELQLAEETAGDENDDDKE